MKAKNRSYGKKSQGREVRVTKKKKEEIAEKGSWFQSQESDGFGLLPKTGV